MHTVMRQRVLRAARVQDLLSNILVADPNDRYTIRNIIQHPWFQTDLPGRALKMNDDYLVLTPEGQGFQQLDEIKAILAQVRSRVPCTACGQGRAPSRRCTCVRRTLRGLALLHPRHPPCGVRACLAARHACQRV